MYDWFLFAVNLLVNFLRHFSLLTGQETVISSALVIWQVHFDTANRANLVCRETQGIVESRWNLSDIFPEESASVVPVIPGYSLIE